MNTSRHTVHQPLASPALDHPSQAPASRMSILRPNLIIFLVMTVIVGIGYPLLTTGIAQSLFPDQANGSLIEREGKVVGSRLIGQSFTQPEYFWGRLSATSPTAYNAGASSGSNLGPRNPALAQLVAERLAALKAADPGNTAAVPVDLVSASGSGLDPHISVAAATYQAGRVARARGLTMDAVNGIIGAHTTQPALPVLGEPVVNVLTLNIALDDLRKKGEGRPASR